MILAVLLLLSGLTISAVAIYYSVMGLMAIFSAAAIPIAIMGVSLEVGKLVTASWVKAHWPRLPLVMKTYAVTAVAILMVITSLGIFGFLSKAHSDQTLVSGDVGSKIAIYDEKIKTAKENIEADRKQLKQMDDAVDQIMGRSTDEKGADKANAVRKSQQRDRVSLSRDIEAQQKLISNLNEESAPIRAEIRKVEAEVGPIKYIAAFIYGANPDESILEKAVTWVIILIVIVFDPLAVVMLLASQMTFAWIREDKNRVQDEDPVQNYVKVDEPPTIQELDTFVGEKPTQEEIAEDVEPIKCYKCDTELVDAPGIGLYCPNKNCDVLDGPHLVKPEVVKETVVEPPTVRTWEPEEVVELNQAIEEAVEATAPPEPEPEPEMPSRRMEAAPHPGKKDKGALIVADNAPQMTGKAVNSDFGNVFPENPTKGDVYLRTDYLPNRLFKYNGIKWIEVDKTQSDTYAYNEKYIWHLIDQIDEGKYDPDILTEVERQQIAEQLERSRNA